MKAENCYIKCKKCSLFDAVSCLYENVKIMLRQSAFVVLLLKLCPLWQVSSSVAPLLSKTLGGGKVF